MGSGPARVDQAPDIARTISRAFASDPVWGPALTRTDGRPVDVEPYWRLFVDGALRFGTVRMVNDGSAVSVWLPPGESELSEAQSVELDDLATHPEHRGKGVGQRLLAEDLSAWDAVGVPAYLESTNPANDHRYARAGFRPDGGFSAVRTEAWVSAMWRPVGGA